MADIQNMAEFSKTFSEVSGDYLSKDSVDIKDYLDTQPRELRNFIVSLVDLLNSKDGAKSLSATDSNGNKAYIQDLIDYLHANKVDQGGNFSGTWNWLSPTQTDPFIQSVVNDNTSKLRSIVDEFSGTNLIAHRGAMNLAPENTIPSFELAGKYGYKFIKCDVSVTSDGALAINHDATVDAMTDGTGNVSSFTLAQLQALNVDSGANIAAYEGTKLCTLEDVLKVCVKYNMIPFIDMKNLVNTVTDVTNIYNLINKYGMVQRCIVCSANKTWLEYMRGLNTVICMYYFVTGVWDTADITYCKSLGNCMYGCSRYNATSDNIQYCHNNNVKMVISSPVGNGSMDLLSERYNYTKLGVDFIMTGSLL